MQKENRYIPGVCNIGNGEIKKRKLAGWAGLVITVLLCGSLVYSDAPRVLRLAVFIPATVAAIGFLQARFHFCAYFGMRGVYNFTYEIGVTEAVEEAEFRTLDRRKARRVIIYSVIIGMVVALIAYYLPV